MACRVLIVGAGIAGTALARALRAKEIDAVLVEQAERWQDGSGIFLPGNGVRALERLGLAEELVPKGARIRYQRFWGPDGSLLGEADVDRLWAGVAPCLALHRSDLQEALVEGGAEPLAVRMGTTVQRIDQRDDGIAVLFSDGSTGDFDVVVGADGLRSSVRHLVFGDISPEFATDSYWRTVVPDPVGIEGWNVYFQPSGLMGLVAIGGGHVYCFGSAFTDEPFPDPAPGRAERFRARFGGIAVADPILADLTDEAIHFGPAERVFVDPPVRGCVALVGDAAHANSPNMAQGGCMAMEDGLVLADELAAGGDPLEALERYATRRLPRTRHVRDATEFRTQSARLPLDAARDLLANVDEIVRLSFAPLLPEP